MVCIDIHGSRLINIWHCIQFEISWRSGTSTFTNREYLCSPGVQRLTSGFFLLFLTCCIRQFVQFQLRRLMQMDIDMWIAGAYTRGLLNNLKIVRSTLRLFLVDEDIHISIHCILLSGARPFPKTIQSMC